MRSASRVKPCSAPHNVRSRVVGSRQDDMSEYFVWCEYILGADILGGKRKYSDAGTSRSPFGPTSRKVDAPARTYSHSGPRMPKYALFTLMNVCSATMAKIV